MDLSELIAKKMSNIVKNKQGQVILNDEGNPMTTMEAIAMSIVQNAMKGDTSSIMLIRNLTKKTATAEEIKEMNDMYNEDIRHFSEQIKNELEADDLWFEQNTETEMIAKMMSVSKRLELIMQSPDYEDLIYDITKNGNQTVRLNPLHARLDEIQRQIRDEFQRLKADAQKRKTLERLKQNKEAL